MDTLVESIKKYVYYCVHMLNYKLNLVQYSNGIKILDLWWFDNFWPFEDQTSPVFRSPLYLENHFFHSQGFHLKQSWHVILIPLGTKRQELVLYILTGIWVLFLLLVSHLRPSQHIDDTKLKGDFNLFIVITLYQQLYFNYTYYLCIL